VWCTVGGRSITVGVYAINKQFGHINRVSLTVQMLTAMTFLAPNWLFT
jgi:hypothetical protein